MVKGQIRYHRQYLKLHKQWETYAEPIVKIGLDKSIQPVIDFLNDSDVDALTAYLPYLVEKQPMQLALGEIYPVIGSQAAEFSYNSIQNSPAVQRKLMLQEIEYKSQGATWFQRGVDPPHEQKDFSFFNAEWIRDMVDYFLLNAGTKIQGITDTTIERIRTLLKDTRERNLSRRDEAKYIQEQLNDPEFNRNRAKVIARTESNTAANHGIHIGGDSSDYYVNKSWIATLDKRTRRDHRIAGLNYRPDTPIPFNTPFIVGGVAMMYPGDATAPADQCVNCRCVEAVIPVTDEYGLPVLKPRSQKVEI